MCKYFNFILQSFHLAHETVNYDFLSNSVQLSVNTEDNAIFENMQLQLFNRSDDDFARIIIVY